MTRIFNPVIEWNDQGNPVSSGFDDIYYSRQNGLQETDLVFHQGNNLPAAWIGQDQFTIAETGFGTGLNFLSTWKKFEETAKDGERLDFISVEQFPMHKDDLAKALSGWREALEDFRVNRLLEVYPPRFPGFHRRWITDRVTLTLIFDEALRGFKQLTCPVDAWFLDGFAPKKNPEMWNPELYREIARLSHSKTTLGSFTAVGDVRRGLKEVGFIVKREKGYAYKYHRTVGKFGGENLKPVIQKPDSVTIIGAGLAGATCAYALKRRGIKTVLLEKNAELGMGASGNQLGLINPKIEVQDNPRNDAGLSAFSFSNHILKDMTDIDYTQTGALHLPANNRKQEKQQKLAQQTDWLFPHLQQKENGIFYSDSASVNTAKLVKQLLGNTSIQFNVTIDKNHLPDGTVILASGWGLNDFITKDNIHLQSVRGQVTYAEIPDLALPYPMMFGNYIAPFKDNVFTLGASFEKDNADPAINDIDDQNNIEAAKKTIPFSDYTITGHWAQIRTASKDRFPITGQIPDQQNVYVSGALGSHGIQFSLLHAEILACMLTGAPLPVGEDARQALSIERFY